VRNANKYLYLAIAENTRLTYGSGVKSYLNYCSQAGITIQFPANAKDIIIWLGMLADKDLKINTIRVYLSALYTQHREMGMTSPGDDALNASQIHRMMNGIKRALGVGDVKQRMPVTANIIRSIAALEVRHIKPYWHKLFLAAMSTGTFGLLRSGEFTCNKEKNQEGLTLSQIFLYDSSGRPINLISATDAEIKNISYFSIHLLKSKTDPFRKSATIFINNITATTAMINYLTIHPARQKGTSPLFCYENLMKLDKKSLVENVRIYIDLLGLPDANLYQGHSFRRGGAQSLKDIGTDSATIQKMGRWASDAHLLYTTTPLSFFLATCSSM
jgi:Phage integrase, N-terminal SAM-like domain